MVSLNYKICLIGIYPTKSVVHESHTLCRVSSVCHGYLINSEKSTQCSLKFVWNVGHEFLRGLNLFWLVWLQRVVLISLIEQLEVWNQNLVLPPHTWYLKDLNWRTLQFSLGPQKIIKAPGLLISCGPKVCDSFWTQVKGFRWLTSRKKLLHIFSFFIKEHLHPLSALSVGFRLDPGIILSSNDCAACLIIVGSSEQMLLESGKVILVLILGTYMHTDQLYYFHLGLIS